MIPGMATIFSFFSMEFWKYRKNKGLEYIKKIAIYTAFFQKKHMYYILDLPKMVSNL